jgi:hypothetical protein
MPLHIKSLILEMVGRCVSDFQLIPTKGKGYAFRSDSDLPHYKFFAIYSSQKYRVLSCDVAWGFFREWDYTYGTHQMTNCIGLPNLRLGSKAIPSTESLYKYDGTELGMRNSLDRIGSELVTYGLPWFRNCFELANEDLLLRYGLDWVEKHFDSIPTTFREDLRLAFVRASNKRHRLELQPLDTLKKDLREFASTIAISTWHRKETGILAEALLLYGSDAKGNSSP